MVGVVASDQSCRGKRGVVNGARTVLGEIFGEGGVHLGSVPVDYSENQRVLVEELRQAFPGNA